MYNIKKFKKELDWSYTIKRVIEILVEKGEVNGKKTIAKILKEKELLEHKKASEKRVIKQILWLKKIGFLTSDGKTLKLNPDFVPLNQRPLLI